MHWRVGVTLLAMVAACGKGAPVEQAPASARAEGAPYTVRDTVVTATLEASGRADPVQQATLSTRLMGTVTSVLVHEGERVRAGQVLLRIDAREVESKRAQVDAGIASAEAMYQDAVTQANRFRALYADSAATKYQLEQVETGLTRAEAGLRSARAARAELDAVGSYAEVRAPFDAVVTGRMVDPGAFAAPGAPLVALQEDTRLRISVAVPPTVARGMTRGKRIDGEIEGVPVQAVIEGVVPAGAGSVATINALVDNRDRQFLGGSAAILRVPAGTRHAIMVPETALVREGDLTGVRVKQGAGFGLRWVKTGESFHAPRTTLAAESGRNAERGMPAPMVEVLSGLAVGDIVLTAER